LLAPSGNKKNNGYNLSNLKTITQQMNAKLVVHSSIQSTTFAVAIPVIEKINLPSAKLLGNDRLSMNVSRLLT